ncbi:hypothetical protein NDU88_006455 [Pleurodeles waltl]|uniref:Uncharacterized protein n=1 Tax=Pleurodeles waltl TaxID=8319 RepID=A0AAV7QLT5_PLEWA|nr:hypothetical protein NDU88_006455 [Pleurodeles waltl]
MTGPTPRLAGRGCPIRVTAGCGLAAGPGGLWRWPRRRLETGGAVSGLRQQRIWLWEAPAAVGPQGDCLAPFPCLSPIWGCPQTAGGRDGGRDGWWPP